MVNAACIQTAPRFGEVDGNVERSVTLLREAAAMGAGIAVLPELAGTGYMFESRAEALALAERVPEGPACRAWGQAARELGMLVVAGVAERDGDRLFNSAVVLGPAGHVGTYRKMHLWDRENEVFDRGDLGFPVFDTEHGRVGVLVCYDAWFPESFRCCATAGADLVCMPANWVLVPGHRDRADAMQRVLCMAAAHVNGMYVLAADRVGEERGQRFMGRSVIVGPDGWPIAGPAGVTEEQIIVAPLDVQLGRQTRRLTPFNELLMDRRLDAYGAVVAPLGAGPAALRSTGAAAETPGT